MTQIQSLNDRYTLNNNVQIPGVGFGTWQMPNDEQTVQAVKKAISVGYRHIDTAQGYGNEEAVGRAVRESGIPREEIFLTTKIDDLNHEYDNTVRSLNESLRTLGVDYIDLVLIHWPNPKQFRDHWQEANAGTWKAMEEFYEAGKIRAIGISNFLPHHIDALLENAKHKPMVNQILLCPGLVQNDAVDYCRRAGILLEAYSPLGTGQVLDSPELIDMAEKYAKSPAQVALRWSLQMGFLPLPKTKTMKRIEENADIFDFELSDEDVETLSTLDNGVELLKHPDD